MIDNKGERWGNPMTHLQSNLPHNNISNSDTKYKHYPEVSIYNPNNTAKGQIAEDLVRDTFTINGIAVKPHEIDDGGCDGIFTYGSAICCYEVNYWKPNTYFKEERVDGIDCNLVNGFNYVNNNFIPNKVKHKLHICIGVKRTRVQMQQAKAVGIKVIYFRELPSKEALWNKINSILENPHLKFYKIRCIGNNHLRNNDDGAIRSSVCSLNNAICYPISDTEKQIQRNSHSSVIKSSIKCRLKGFRDKLTRNISDYFEGGN